MLAIQITLREPTLWPASVAIVGEIFEAVKRFTTDGTWGGILVTLSWLC